MNRTDEAFERFQRDLPPDMTPDEQSAAFNRTFLAAWCKFADALAGFMGRKVKGRRKPALSYDRFDDIPKATWDAINAAADSTRR